MHFSITIILVSKSKKMRWARNVASMREKKAYSFGGEALSSKITWKT